MKKCDIDIISFSFFLFVESFIYSLVHNKNKNKFYFYQFSYWFQHILLLIFMIHRMINRTQNRFFSKCFFRKITNANTNKNTKNYFEIVFTIEMYICKVYKLKRTFIKWNEQREINHMEIVILRRSWMLMMAKWILIIITVHVQNDIDAQ